MDDLVTSTEAARIAGVGTTAIKRWADAGSLQCIRTPGGHRRFSRRDVLRLATSAGHSSDQDDWSDWIDTLVCDGNVYRVQARLFEERARRGSWHGVADALGGLVSEIGRWWEAGDLSVIEEHVASASLARALAAVAETVPVSPEAARCLLATAERDEHTLGLSLVELCLREAGWRAEWAGSRTRVTDILNRLANGGIGMVALSAAASTSNANALAVTANAVGNACLRANTALVLGGEGAWPDEPAYGVRFRTFAPFHAYAEGLKEARWRAAPSVSARDRSHAQI